MIKHKELKKVVQDCLIHTTEIIKTSTLLYNNHKFPTAIFIAIISLEEIGKFATFCEYLRKFEDLPDDIEEKLRSSHKYKLNQILKLEENRIKVANQHPNHLSLCEPTINFAELLCKNSQLDKIKQLAIYYDYKLEKSVDLYNHCKHKIPLNNLGHFCFILQHLVHCNFSMEILRLNHGDKNGIIMINKALIEDKNYVNLNTALNNINLKKTSVDKYSITFYELITLYDALYKNNN